MGKSMHQALSGIKVIELAGYISGPYCGLLLGGLGADVVKIEEPILGDLARRNGPFPDHRPHPDHSGLFVYLNRNKRGVTLDIKTETGQQIFLNLLKEADVLIEDLPPKSAQDLRLDYPNLKDVNSQLIVVSITPFGQTGPYRDFKAYAINASAIGGMSSIVGEPKREPLTPPLSLGHFQTGIIAANATLFALMARKKIGKGQQIDISEVESWAIFHTGNVVSSFVYSGRKRTRTGHRTPSPYPYTILPCKNGYLSMIALRGSEWKRFLEIVGEGTVPEWYSSDERFQDRLKAGQQYAELLDNLLAPWLMSHTKEEIFSRCRAEHVPFTPVRSMEEVANCGHLNSRRYFEEIDHAGTNKFKCPGPPVRFSESPWDFNKPAPSLSEHNVEIYHERLGYSKKELARLRNMGII